MCEWDSSHVHYMVKVLSCQFTKCRDKSKFMGNNRNNIETPPGRVAEHFAISFPEHARSRVSGGHSSGETE